MTEARYATIPDRVLTYPVVWRCRCGAPAFGTYDLASPADDPQRLTVEAAALAHRATHKREDKR